MKYTIMKKISLILVVALLISATYNGQGITVSAKARDSAAHRAKAVAEISGETVFYQAIDMENEMVADTTTANQEETTEGDAGEITPEETTTGEPITENPTPENPTTEEPTTVDYVIIDGVYKVKNGVLIEYLGAKKDKKTTSIKIPAAITKIDNSVFEEYKYIEKVTFESASRLTEIGNYAFKKCAALKTIKVPDSLKIIGKHAFYGCKKLESFAIPSGVTEIKKSTFFNCESLTKVTTKKKIKTIAKYAFKNCTSLTSLTIYKKTTSIGASVFAGDKKLVLKVYANSTGKAYARKNNIPWEYTASEIKRRNANQKIYNDYMKLISTKNKNRFILRSLSDYVPQGTCIIGKYLVVSMYHKNLQKNSILLVYNKSTGSYVKTVVLPSKDHVGSVTNVKDRLVIGLNNISAKDYVAVISKSRLNKIKNGKKIKYNYTRALGGYADYASFDGTHFWAGQSGNISYATMQGYKVKVKKKKLVFTRVYSYYVPRNIQGLAVQKTSKNKRKFIFSQSYGRINNSSLITYSINLKKAKSIGTPKSTKTLPSMSEGVTLTKKGYLFMVFESGAGLYCGNPDNTSEIQINNICKIKYSLLK